MPQSNRPSARPLIRGHRSERRARTRLVVVSFGAARGVRPVGRSIGRLVGEASPNREAVLFASLPGAMLGSDPSIGELESARRLGEQP